jgi:hypothetical protein
MLICRIIVRGAGPSQAPHEESLPSQQLLRSGRRGSARTGLLRGPSFPAHATGVARSSPSSRETGGSGTGNPVGFARRMRRTRFSGFPSPPDRAGLVGPTLFFIMPSPGDGRKLLCIREIAGSCRVRRSLTPGDRCRSSLAHGTGRTRGRRGESAGRPNGIRSPAPKAPHKGTSSEPPPPARSRETSHDP